MRSSLLFFLLTLVLLSSCRDDLEDFSVTTESNLPPAITVNATITGLVLTPPDRPFPSGTLVSSPGLGTVTTNEIGRFSFPPGPVNANGQEIRVHLGDDRFALRTVMPNPGATIYEIIQAGQMESLQFSGTQGGELEFENGVKLSIPAGSARLNGESFNGQVFACTSPMLPESIDDMLNSPGNARGFKDGEFVTLESYGMIETRLSTLGGEAITFDPLAPARLFFPLTSEVAENAPDSIDFWQIEDASWFNDGRKASLEGLFYSAPITGSGTYNCDVPHLSTRMYGQLTNAAGAPMPHHLFALSVDNGQIVNTARTDDKGRFCAWGPRDVDTDLIVIDPCSGEWIETFVGNVGGTDLNIGVVSIDANTTIIPTNLENCSGGEVLDHEGLGIYVNGYEVHKFYYHANEDFSASIALPDCGNAEEFSIQAISLDKRKVSRIMKRNANDASPVTFEVCSLLDDDEIFNLTIDGVAATATGLTSYFERQDFSGATNYHVEITGSLPNGDDFFMLFEFDEANVGGFTGIPTDVYVNHQDPTGLGPRFSYRLEDDEDFIVNITSVSNDQSTVSGNFSFLARQRSSEQPSDIGFDIPVTASFQLNL